MSIIIIFMHFIQLFIILHICAVCTVIYQLEYTNFEILHCIYYQTVSNARLYPLLDKVYYWTMPITRLYPLLDTCNYWIHATIGPNPTKVHPG